MRPSHLYNKNPNTGKTDCAPTSTWWRHQMETFPFYRSFVREFTGHRWILLTKASDAELWYVLWSAHWMNGWLCNRGDVRRHRAHHDAIMMKVVLMKSTWIAGKLRIRHNKRKILCTVDSELTNDTSTSYAIGI